MEWLRAKKMRIKNQYKLTYLLVHIDLILHYLFNKLYKIQVIQNTGYTKYTWFLFLHIIIVLFKFLFVVIWQRLDAIGFRIIQSNLFFSLRVIQNI